MDLSLERVIKGLIGLGLTRIDGEAYVYLAKVGPQRVIDLTKALNYDKQKIYTSLKNLQEKGIAKVTSQKDSIFSVLPFEEALELLIKIEKDQVIKETKEELLARWEIKDWPDS